jgi:cysteine desulfurase/selenocysteine lyase
VSTAEATAPAPATQTREAPLDVEAIRRDFPILATEMRGKPLVYLDTAASSQKPQVVIDAVSEFYSTGYANIHRGLYELSANATRRFEAAREKVQAFIGARDDREIVFVRNATEAMNLVAMTWGRQNVDSGDEIIVSALEHHANIVPWQQLCAEKGAVLRVIPVNDRGELEPGAFEALLSERTKLLAITHVSNALGTINPAKELVRVAHEHGVTVLLDGAQAVPHMPVDVADLDCDFYAFSGHKLFAPSGVGVLYGKLDVLNGMPPFLTGGEMIETVTFEKSTFKTAPHRFEAGTPDIAGVIGLGAAIDYLNGIGMDRIAAWEHALLEYSTAVLEGIPDLTIIGTARDKAAVLSFVLEGAHPHDVATVLDQEGVAVRAGHHCAQPIMDRFGVAATTRASLSFYNTREEIDVLESAIRKTLEIFGNG